MHKISINLHVLLGATWFLSTIPERRLFCAYLKASEKVKVLHATHETTDHCCDASLPGGGIILLQKVHNPGSGQKRCPNILDAKFLGFGKFVGFKKKCGPG